MNNKNNDENKSNKKDEFRKNIDLLYLTNRTNLMKFKKPINKEISCGVDVKKYKKFILSCTKKLLNNELISPEINNIFDTYIYHLIRHFKFKNRNKIIQEQYKNIDNEKKIEKYNPINIEKMDINIIGKKKETKKIDLNAFVKKKKHKNKKKIIIPKKKNYD
jgi:hypothetical protein